MNLNWPVREEALTGKSPAHGRHPSAVDIRDLSAFLQTETPEKVSTMAWTQPPRATQASAAGRMTSSSGMG